MASKGYMAKIGLDLSGVDKSIRQLQNELKTIDKAFNDSGSSALLAGQQYDVLAEAINRTREKLDQLLSAQADAERAHQAGTLSDEEYRAYQREVENTSNALYTLTQRFIGLDPNVTESTELINANREAVAKADQQIVEWAQSLDSKFGVAIQKAVQLIGAFAKECVETGKQFETSMSLVAATMGVDEMSEDYQKLEEAAKQYGATTRYTASQVAEALNYMALAGYDADRSIETLPNLLNLAQAGGLDFARASEMLTNSVMALGLESDEVADYIDKMAVTARSSGTNVEQLGEAILKVGGTARSIVRDGDTTELDTMLGALADNGIKAAEGGTKLRNILIKMAKPTKGTTTLLETLNMSFYDMEGNMRPLPEIFTEINDKMTELNMTQQERDNLLAGAFNARDLAAINALVNTTADRYGELEEKISAANGAAQQMGETMNDNLQGALYQLTSAKEDVEIELYQKIEEPLKQITNTAADVLRGISAEIKESDFGEEFTAAMQKVADKVQEELPRLIGLFEEFSATVVPALGDMTEGIIDFVADDVFPKAIDLAKWIIDHGESLTGVIQALIGALAANKMILFANSVKTGFENVAQLGNVISTVLPSATALGDTVGGAVAPALTSMGVEASASSVALGGLAAVGIAAAIAAALALKSAIDDATEAMIEQQKFANGFTETSNDNLDRYVQLTRLSGEEASKAAQSWALADKTALSEEKKALEELERQKAEKMAEGYMEGSEGLYDLEKQIAQAKKNVETYENLVRLEDRVVSEYQKESKIAAAAEKAAADKAGTQSAMEFWMSGGIDPVQAAEDQAAREEEARQLEIEAFSEDLETQEKLWDEKYHWDKENVEEYWRERSKWLKENEADCEAWWKAWNTTEKKIGKADTNTQKEIASNLKDRNTQIKDALTSYKNDLDLAIAQGTMTESEANDKLEEYLNTKLDHSTDLYKTEMTKVLETRQKIENNLTKEEETTLKAAVTAQDKAIDKRWKELENLAKEEDWSNEKLYDEKYKVLEKYKKEGELYLDNEEKYNEKLETLHAKITEDNRKVLAKQLEEKQKLTKKLFGEAEKVAQKQISEYEKNADKIAGAIDKPTTVTDSKGNERLVFSDYSKKLQELRTYQENLKKLESMGLSDTHIKEIFDMDFDTRMKYVAELVRMSSGQREKYLADYEAYQKASGNISSSEARINKDAVKDSIIEGFKDIDTSAYASGEDAWNAYVNGWLVASKNTPLADLFSFSDLTGVSADDILTTKAGTTVWKAKNADGTDKTKKVYNDQGQELVVNVYTDGEKTFVKRINASEQKKINVSAKT